MENNTDYQAEQLSLKEAILVIFHKIVPQLWMLFLSLGMAAAVCILARAGVLKMSILVYGLSALMIFPAAYSTLVITVLCNAASDLIFKSEDHQKYNMMQVKACVQKHTDEVLGSGWTLMD